MKAATMTTSPKPGEAHDSGNGMSCEGVGAPLAPGRRDTHNAHKPGALTMECTRCGHPFKGLPYEGTCLVCFHDKEWIEDRSEPTPRAYEGR